MLRLDQVKDPEVLRRAALLLEQENRKLIDKVVALHRKLLAAEGKAPEDLQLRIAELEQQLAQRNRTLFGRSSEKRAAPDAAPEKTDPAIAAPPTPAATPDPTQRADGKPARPGHGRRAQPSLPVVEQTHALDAPDCACPKCGATMPTWDGHTEDADEIDVLERRFVVRRHRRAKHRCTCGHIETALGPEKLVEGGRYSIDFAVEVALDKYLDHLPLERQVRAMARAGLVVDAQTLFDQLWWLTRPLVPAYTALHSYVLSSRVVLADETRWPLLGHDGTERPGPSRWHIWAVARLDAVFYKVHDTRGRAAADAILGGFSGILVADHYAVYDAFAADHAEVRRAACWAHYLASFVMRSRSLRPRRERAHRGARTRDNRSD